MASPRFALCLVMSAAVVLTACDPGEPKQYTAAETTAASPELAARFAPLVRLAEGETLKPMDATRFVEGSALRYDHRGACPDEGPVADPVDARKLGKGDYKHTDVVPGEPSPEPVTCPGHGGPEHSTADDPTGFYLDPPDALRGGDGTGAPVYWELHKDDQGRTAYVYWFFYGYNDLLIGNKHEGDWERVAVQMRGDEPVAVTFAKHGGDPCMVPWLELQRQQEHPVVYSARGSHGSYATDGFHRVAHTVDRTSDKGEAWETWSNARPVDKEPWWGYRGWWGAQVGMNGFNGPMGPYPKRFLPGVFTDQRCEPRTDDPPVPELPPRLEGVWETREPVTQTPVAPGYQMRVTLAKDKSRVQYRSDWTDPDVRLDCGGVLTPTTSTAQFVEVRETIDSDVHRNCVPEGTVRLELSGDSLKMTNTGGGVTATATLYRPSTPKTTEQQAVPKTKEGAIQRYEQFLHALGKEDIGTVCEIAGPGAKVAEDKGFGPCKSTYAVVFQMISAKQKTALKTATIDPSLVAVRSPGKVEIPVEAVKSSATFTDDDLGGYTLEYLKDNWFITGSPTS